MHVLKQHSLWCIVVAFFLKLLATLRNKLSSSDSSVSHKIKDLLFWWTQAYNFLACLLHLCHHFPSWHCSLNLETITRWWSTPQQAAEGSASLMWILRITLKSSLDEGRKSACLHVCFVCNQFTKGNPSCMVSLHTFSQRTWTEVQSCRIVFSIPPAKDTKQQDIDPRASFSLRFLWREGKPKKLGNLYIYIYIYIFVAHWFLCPFGGVFLSHWYPENWQAVVHHNQPHGSPDQQHTFCQQCLLSLADPRPADCLTHHPKHVSHNGYTCG